ncbi:MAG: hypothetical protein ACI31V_04165 [Bacilli bacterium]
MKNKEMTKEAKEFIDALKFLNHRDGKAEIRQLEEDTVLIYEIWYKEISTECAKIYTKTKIREVKKQLLADAKKQIKRIQERQLKGYNSITGKLAYTEDRMITDLQKSIKYIENLNEEDLIDLIISSLYGSAEYIETLKHRKEEMEKSKLGKLSYKGEKAVEDDQINDEIVQKIYNDIKGKGLFSISKRVETTLSTNEQFKDLRETERHAREIITCEIAKIYRDKIEKIRHEIQEELGKLKYKDFANTDELNLVRVKAKLEADLANAGLLTSRKTKSKMIELISSISGTIQHTKDFEEYTARVTGFQMTDQMKNVFDETTVKNEIREHRKAIMNRTGIIIDKISDEIIEYEAEQLRKEVKAKAKVINDKVETMCTAEERIKVEEFAHTIGLSVKEAIGFLRQEESIYPCLFTHIFAQEVLSKLDDNNAETILNDIDPKWPGKRNRVIPAANRLYTQKEETKPQIETKQYKIIKTPKK